MLPFTLILSHQLQKSLLKFNISLHLNSYQSSFFFRKKNSGLCKVTCLCGCLRLPSYGKILNCKGVLWLFKGFASSVTEKSSLKHYWTMRGKKPWLADWFLSHIGPVTESSCQIQALPVPWSAAWPIPGTLVFAHPSSSGRSMPSWCVCSGSSGTHLSFTHAYTLFFTCIREGLTSWKCLSCRMKALSRLQIPTNWRIFSNPGPAVTRFCWSHRWALPCCRQLQKTRTQLLATNVILKATSAGYGQMCELSLQGNEWKWASRQGNLQPPPQLFDAALTTLVLAAPPKGTHLAPHTVTSSVSEERHMQRSFSPF